MIKPSETKVADQRPEGGTRLDLHIEELVLLGFDHVDRMELGTVVEQSLTRLFAERGVPSSFHDGGSIDGLDGGTFTTHRDSGARDLGSHIANSVYGSFRS